MPVSEAPVRDPRQAPLGLSAHARALWQRADKYRRLADDLARADAESARA